MEGYLQTGRFPRATDDIGTEGYVETAVKTKYPGEFTRTYVVLGAVYLIWRIAARIWAAFSGAL